MGQVRRNANLRHSALKALLRQSEEVLVPQILEQLDAARGAHDRQRERAEPERRLERPEARRRLDFPDRGQHAHGAVLGDAPLLDRVDAERAKGGRACSQPQV